MNEGIHLDLDTWIVPGQIRKANLCRGLGNRYTPAGTEARLHYHGQKRDALAKLQPTLSQAAINRMNVKAVESCLEDPTCGTLEAFRALVPDLEAQALAKQQQMQRKKAAGSSGPCSWPFSKQGGWA